MYKSKSAIALIVMILLTLAGSASAGWVIDQTVKGGKGSKEGDHDQILLQANQMKITMFEGEKPVGAAIMDFNGQTITQIRYDDKSYVTSPIKEFVQTIKSAMNSAMKQMEEAMKQVPPEQRKMMEEMMKSQMPKEQDCPEAKVEVRKTGKQETIAGYPAVSYEALTDGKLTSEFWLTKGINAWKELDPAKLQEFGAEMQKLVGCKQGESSGSFDPSWKVTGDGFPVRTVDKTGTGTIIEVVKAESKAIPATEFKAPAGFTQKTYQELMSQ